MFDNWIIVEILKKEKEGHQEDQPQIQLPLEPPSEEYPEEELPEPPDNRGVVVIDNY